MMREVQVAFSRRAQPVWFRALKWVLIVGATRRYRHTRAFRFWAVGLLIAACTLHLFYRWKTNVWTRAWGGWDDPAFVQPGPAAD